MLKEETVCTYEMPRTMDVNNVMYWCPETKEVKGSVKNKALRFVRDNLVKENIDIRDEYFVLPIAGYNSTAYLINSEGCNCQGFKKNGTCSHVLAVVYFKRIKEYKWR